MLRGPVARLLLLAVVPLVALLWLGARDAKAAACPSVQPIAQYMTLSPGGVDLTEGNSATVQASVGAIDGLIPAPAGQRVAFTVTCGPDEGQSYTTTTGPHFAYEPGRSQALFTVHNHGLLGTDEITATSSFRGHQTRAVIALQWSAKPANCDSALGILAAFRCAYRIAAGASETIKCAVAVGGFLIPGDKFATLIKDAGTLAAAKTEARALGASSSVAAVAADLRQLATADHVSVGQLAQTFHDARNATEFLHDVWSLAKDAVTDPAVSQLAYDIAKLTGLDSCVALLSHLLGPPSPTYGPVDIGQLCFGSDNVFIDAVNGCPYDGGPTVTVSSAPLSYQILIESNDDSVTPSYWDLINFPNDDCRSITLNFAIPDGGGEPGDVAGIAVTSSGASPQAASVAYGQVGTLSASLTGGAWSLENTATDANDQIAINGTAQCSSPTGY
jgi:hypothetical protein